MTNIKILGTGCVSCKRLLADVNALVAKNNWQVRVEYVTDLPTIMSYNVLSTPALVVDEKVLLIGHPGAVKVELVLKQTVAA